MKFDYPSDIGPGPTMSRLIQALKEDEPVTRPLPAAFDSINGATGFANGDEFDTVEQVRAYFTPEVQRDMFGWDAITDPVTLSGWAELVIVNGWHMRTK